MLCVGEEDCCCTSETGALCVYCTVYYYTYARVRVRVLCEWSVLVFMTLTAALVCLGFLVLAFAQNGRQTQHFFALEKWGLFYYCIVIYMVPERP